MADDERMHTPDDPDFEGAEFISREAMIEYKVTTFSWLGGITWSWSRWSSEVDDHDHCVICHEAAFSTAYEGDLREGWQSVSFESPLWLCPTCFERFRDRLGWQVAV